MSRSYNGGAAVSTPTEPAEERIARAERDLALRFAQRVRLYATRQLQDETAAQDVTQDTLRIVLDAVRSDRLRDADALPGFVFQTARNLCLHWVRSAARERSALSKLMRTAAAWQGDGDALTRLITEERAARVREALTRLSRQDGQLLQLLYFDGADTTVVARGIGVTAMALRVRKHRALQRLAALLTDVGDDGTSSGAI